MKTSKIYFLSALMLAAAFTFQSCKSKKLLAKPKPVAPAPAPVTKPVTPPAPEPVKTVTPPPQAPDLVFTNVQFDFNSSVLRTDAIQYLDHVVTEMKLSPSTNFILKGYASIEGTAAHNMVLSEDRANAVKQYLVNGGISGAMLATKGYGAKHPIASNKTEENRRVEIKIAK
jgi:outer membrane protein OmpA-like peptidoglycan-associated protein